MSSLLRERVHECLKQPGKSAAGLARACGIKQPSVSDWLSGRTKKIEGSNLLKAAEYLEVTPLWLAEGKGLMRGTVIDLVAGEVYALAKNNIAEEPHAAYNIAPIEPGVQFIPVSRVLFKLSAGVTGYQVEPLEGNGPPIFFRRDWFEQRGYQAAKLFAVKINGASMEPGLFDGDLVVINTADTKPIDGEPFAANYEGELVIKRLKRDGGEWWLASDNDDKRRYPDKRCDENASLIGRVVYKQSERV